MGMYDNNRLFSQSELQNNMMNAQEMLSPYQPISYEQQNTSQSDQQIHNVYVGKSSRLQYVNTPKIVTQSEPYKYNTGKSITRGYFFDVQLQQEIIIFVCFQVWYHPHKLHQKLYHCCSNQYRILNTRLL